MEMVPLSCFHLWTSFCFDFVYIDVVFSFQNVLMHQSIFYLIFRFIVICYFNSNQKIYILLNQRKYRILATTEKIPTLGFKSQDRVCIYMFVQVSKVKAVYVFICLLCVDNVLYYPGVGRLRYILVLLYCILMR